MRRDCCQKRRIACFGGSFSVAQEKMEWKLQDLRLLQILQQSMVTFYCTKEDFADPAVEFIDYLLHK